MYQNHYGYMPTSPTHGQPPQQQQHLQPQYQVGPPAPSAVPHSQPHGLVSSPQYGYGQGGTVGYNGGGGGGYEGQLAKIVTIVAGETGEEQNFRLCAGESGDNVRAAIMGAFGVGPLETFSIRDATGCNIIIGYPSVVDGGRYEMVRRGGGGVGGGGNAVQQHLPLVHTQHPPATPAPIVPLVVSAPTPAPVPVPVPVSPRSYQQTIQPTVSQSLSQVHHITSDPPPPRPRVTYQEVVTTRPPAKETTPGPRNNKHHQASPMPGAFKTLIVGINYTGQKEGLTTCANDAQAMRGYLGEAGFHGQQLVLTDENQTDPAHVPTRENIMRGLRWLCQGAKAGDALVLHFAGHGVEVRDEADEDRYDEAVLPVDFRATRPFQVIKNEEMTQLLTSSLPHGSRLMVIADCAHSGQLLNLPYSLTARKDGNLEWKEKVGYPEPQPEIIQLSGCRNDQTTDSATNALTPAFIQAMGRDTNPTFESLIVEVRNNLYKRSGVGYQVPQVSSSKRFAFTDRFYLCVDP